MQIREFFSDALEVPARNVQSLLKVKIPAVIQFFKIPSRTGGVKKVSTPHHRGGGRGGANYDDITFHMRTNARLGFEHTRTHTHTHTHAVSFEKGV